MAIYEGYNRECIYCHNIVEWRDFEVDHILNESLGQESERLDALLHDYGLSNDFRINDFENLACTHKQCNRAKADTTFDKSRALYFLTIAEDKAKLVRKAQRALERGNNVTKVGAQLRALIESGKITPREIADFALSVTRNADIGLNNPIVVCFGISIEDLQHDHPELMFDVILNVDWLESDLASELRAKLGTRIELLESQFNGETLSVRFAIWDFDLDKFDTVNLKWWEVLESGLHTQIYEQFLQDDE